MCTTHRKPSPGPHPLHSSRTPVPTSSLAASSSSIRTRTVVKAQPDGPTSPGHGNINREGIPASTNPRTLRLSSNSPSSNSPSNSNRASSRDADLHGTTISSSNGLMASRKQILDLPPRGVSSPELPPSQLEGEREGEGGVGDVCR
jgi:hypothetical protein